MAELKEDKFYPIGDPAIKKVASDKVPGNIGYSSVVFKEPETNLTGHILCGVNIPPYESKFHNKVISVDQTNRLRRTRYVQAFSLL